MVSTWDGGIEDLANFDHCPMDLDPAIHQGPDQDTTKRKP
jgi:hypothetical protein